MPNGGTLCACVNCGYFRDQDNSCRLRLVKIEDSHWTICRNYTQGSQPLYFKGGLLVRLYLWLLRVVGMQRRIEGPLQIVTGGAYSDGDGGVVVHRIPYFEGIRPEQLCPDGPGAVLRLTDRGGKVHEFPTIDAYIQFYKEAGGDPADCVAN